VCVCVCVCVRESVCVWVCACVCVCVFDIHLKEIAVERERGVSPNTTEGNSRAYRESELLCSHSHGESIAAVCGPAHAHLNIPGGGLYTILPSPILYGVWH